MLNTFFSCVFFFLYLLGTFLPVTLISSFSLSLKDQVVRNAEPLGLPALKCGTPVWWYLLLTAIFWTLSVLNNMAYNFEISQPLHMVFRSSSLAVSLLLGFTLFGMSSCDLFRF